MKTTFIYELYHPNGYKAMYVGKGSIDRALWHWGAFVKRNFTSNSFLKSWFRRLKKQGRRPKVRIREVVDLKSWQGQEKHWIRFWRAKNSRLCNIAPGGNSVVLSLDGHRRLSEMARKQGLKNIESGLLFRNGFKYGHLGGEKTHQNWKEQKKHLTRLGYKYGHLGGQKGSHTRWHVRRGIVLPTCVHCQQEKAA